MAQLIVIKLGEGDFERQGFTVTLQIGKEGTSPSTEITGRLPPAPEILENYQHWHSTNRRLHLRLRLEKPTAQVTNLAIIQECHDAARVLRKA